MTHIRTKLVVASAALIVAAGSALAAEVSAGSEGNGETPRSAPGARTLSERGIGFMPEFDEGNARAFGFDKGAMERGIGTIGRKADGESFRIPASEALKRAL